MGVKRSQYIQESVAEGYTNYIQGTGNLLDMDEGPTSGTNNNETSAIDDLLGMSSSNQGVEE
jgi:hypothetical protein